MDHLSGIKPALQRTIGGSCPEVNARCGPAANYPAIHVCPSILPHMHLPSSEHPAPIASSARITDNFSLPDKPLKTDPLYSRLTTSPQLPIPP